MLELDWGKLVVIGIVALIVIGPKELPTVLRTLGQYIGKVRRMAAEFQGQFQEALREAELHDLKKQADDLTSSVSDMSNFDPLADTQKEIESAFAEPKPEEPAASEPLPLSPPVETTAAEAAPLSEQPAPAAELAPAEPPKAAGGAA